MNNTTITSTQDGSLLVVRETATRLSGNARQRKQQTDAGWRPEWRVIDRVICKNMAVVPDKARPWLLGYTPGDTHLIGAANDYYAQLYAEQARKAVKAIERQITDFFIDFDRDAALYDYTPGGQP